MTGAMAAMLLVSLLLGAFGQLMLKIAMNAHVAAHGEINAVGGLFTALLHPLVLGGLAAYVLSTMLYLTLMSKMNLSLLYPMVALNYLFVTCLAWYFLHEHISGLRIAALAVIVLGVTMVGLSQPPAAAETAAAAPPLASMAAGE